MTYISIQPDLCQKDGICALVCPTKLIHAPIGALPEETPNRGCIACGQCMAFCPTSAIQVEGLDAGLAKAIEPGTLPGSASVAQLLKSRRSIREYKKTPVPQEDIAAILNTASYAPTAKNMRSLRHIVVYEAAAMQRLGDCMAECLVEDHKTGSPVIAEGIGLASYWRKGVDLIFRGAPHLIVTVAPESYWASIDGAINLTYMEIAAHSSGLGVCWAGYVTVAAAFFPAVREELGLQETEVMTGGQMIGYPRIRPRALAPRTSYPVTWR